MTNVNAEPESVNSAFPFRSGYVAPSRQDHQSVVRSTAPARAFDGTPADVAHSTILHADNAFRQHLADIDSVQYSDDGLRRQIQNFQKSPAYLAVAPAVQKVVDTSEATSDATNSVRQSIGDDEVPDAGTEARAQRIWARIKGVLDVVQSGGPLHDAAVKAVTNASPAERRVLAADLGPYLRARGQASTAWLDAALRSTDPNYSEAENESSMAAKVRLITLTNAQKFERAVVGTAAPSGYRSPIFVDPAAGAR